MIEGPDNFFASLAELTKTPFDFTIDPITSPCSAAVRIAAEQGEPETPTLRAIKP